jgi:general stress protein YciG
LLFAYKGINAILTAINKTVDKLCECVKIIENKQRVDSEGKNMNEQNLKSFKTMDEEKQKEIAKMGGEASGEARRRKKLLKEQAEMFLSLPLKNDKIKQDITSMGVDKNDIDNQMPMIVSLWRQVVGGGKNAVAAYNALMATLGENVQKFELTKGTGETIDEIDKYLKGE